MVRNWINCAPCKGVSLKLILQISKSITIQSQDKFQLIPAIIFLKPVSSLCLAIKYTIKSFFLKHPNNLPLRLELGPIEVAHWLWDQTMQFLKPVGHDTPRATKFNHNINRRALWFSTFYSMMNFIWESVTFIDVLYPLPCNRRSSYPK